MITYWIVYVIVIEALRTSLVSAGGQGTLIGIRYRDGVILGADSSLSSSIALTSSKFDKIHIIIDPFPHGGGNNRKINSQQVIAVASIGEQADCDRLVRILTRHVRQYEYEAGLGCDVQCVLGSSDHIYGLGLLHAEAVAHFARGILSKSLRTKDRLSVSLLVAGLVPTSSYQSNDSLDSSLIDSFERVQRQSEYSADAFAEFREEATNQITDEVDEHELPKRLLLQPKLFWLDEYGSIQSLQYGSHGIGSNFVLSILDRSYSRNMTRDQALHLMNECFNQLEKRFVLNSPGSPYIKCIDTEGCHILSK